MFTPTWYACVKSWGLQATDVVPLKEVSHSPFCAAKVICFLVPRVRKGV